MQTLDEIRKQIKNIQGLKSIVRTMKVLASVSIRQYEKAAVSLSEYNRTTELGLQVVLEHFTDSRPKADGSVRKKTGAIVLGSDQGMCGQFNEQISVFAVEKLREMGHSAGVCHVLTVGTHPATRMDAAGQPIAATLQAPTTAAAIKLTVQEILWNVEQWRTDGVVDKVYLFHNRLMTASTFRPVITTFYPIDLKQFHDLRTRSWPTNQLPTYTVDSELLLLNLICQHLFVILSLAMAESLAAENTSRLIAMQVAERNINDRLTELMAFYHQQRQISITSELLDVVSGAEILAAQKPRSGRINRKTKPEIVKKIDPGLLSDFLNADGTAD